MTDDKVTRYAAKFISNKGENVCMDSDVEELEADLARVTAERDALAKQVTALDEDVGAMAAALSIDTMADLGLAEENARLREALRPFVLYFEHAVAQAASQSFTFPDAIADGVQVTDQEIKNARKALKPEASDE